MHRLRMPTLLGSYAPARAQGLTGWNTSATGGMAVNFASFGTPSLPNRNSSSCIGGRYQSLSSAYIGNRFPIDRTSEPRFRVHTANRQWRNLCVIIRKLNRFCFEYTIENKIATSEISLSADTGILFCRLSAQGIT